MSGQGQERLTEMWPQAFDLKNPRPLAVGITDAITAELAKTGAGGRGPVRYAIRSYTSNIRYIQALAAYGARYNLLGKPEGEVTAEQRERAALVLKMIKINKTIFIYEVSA
ncbi:ProQ/FINO family protein [Erwinia amylovora]